MSQSSNQRSSRFGFVVHPLSAPQRALLGIRTLDPPLAFLGRTKRTPARKIATLEMTSYMDDHVDGLLASITELPDGLLSEQAAGVESIVQAVNLCQEAGAQVVGLGAVAAMIGGQGKSVAASVNVPITTGNATTTIAACETVELLLSRLGRRRRLCLLGPPGPVANGIMQLLVNRGHTLRVVAPNIPKPLQRAADTLNEQGYGEVSFIDSVQDALGPENLLVAASSTGGRLRLSELPAQSVVIDVAEPLDVTRDCSRRRDVLVLEGEYLRTPRPLKGGFWRHVYGVITAQRRHIFACFAEPIVIALSGRTDLCTVGRKVPPEVIHDLSSLLSRYGFWVDTLFEAGSKVRTRRLKRFRDPVA